MQAPQHGEQPHKSVRLGTNAMLLGLVGAAIAYLGLWIESDMTGLVGFIMVGIAVPGAIISLVWSIIYAWRTRSASE